MTWVSASQHEANNGVDQHWFSGELQILPKSDIGDSRESGGQFDGLLYVQSVTQRAYNFEERVRQVVGALHAARPTSARVAEWTSHSEHRLR